MEKRIYLLTMEVFLRAAGLLVLAQAFLREPEPRDVWLTIAACFFWSLSGEVSRELARAEGAP
jgi:hypothetical protein